MAIVLKPCQFCGNSPYFKQISTAYSDSSKAADFKIRCDTCGYDFGKTYTLKIEFDLESDNGVKVVSDGRLAAAVEWNMMADNDCTDDDTAEWIYKEVRGTMANVCSACGSCSVYPDKYCGGCGRSMKNGY